MLRKTKPPEQRVVLPDVSWPQFQSLLEELGSERTARLTYFRGKLEMMTPTPDHERCRKLIDSLVQVLAGGLRLQVETIAPIMLVNPGFQCAVESDACYYLETPLPAGVTPDSAQQAEIVFPEDAPPDLLVEVAITKSQVNKLAVYATMSIPEVWRYVTTIGDDVLKGELSMYQLQGDRYIECKSSPRFPFLPPRRVVEFLEQSDTLGLQKALVVLREWMRERV
jgi:Uma2 family endonuclease